MADETKPEELRLSMGESSLYATSEPLTFKLDEYDCPICGVVKSHISVTLGDPSLDGMYCQVCYAKWINKNLPRLTKR